MCNYLAIDPGGTTGIYYQNSKGEGFLEIKKPWKETYLEIKELVKELKIDLLIFEDTNYIGNRSKESLNLFRLLGAIECLPVQVSKVNVLEVKKLTKQLLTGMGQVKEIKYLPGRGKGWMFKGKRVSLHCLEAYLVYLVEKVK